MQKLNLWGGYKKGLNSYLKAKCVISKQVQRKKWLYLFLVAQWHHNLLLVASCLLPDLFTRITGFYAMNRTCRVLHSLCLKVSHSLLNVFNFVTNEKSGWKGPTRNLSLVLETQVSDAFVQRLCGRQCGHQSRMLPSLAGENCVLRQ